MRKSSPEISETPDVSYIKNPEVSHETSDVRIRPIFWFLFWLVVAAVAVHFLIYGLFKVFEQREARLDPKPSPLASERQTVPPEPQLQLIPTHSIHPLDELKKMREEQEQELTSYGWVDEQRGVVRLPIEEAKKKLLERGVPTRKEK